MPRPILALLVSLGAATGLACLRPNPAFGDGDGMTAGDGPGTTVVLPTGEPSTGSTAASTGTASSGGGVDPTTGATATSTTDVGNTGVPICAEIGEPCGECCGCGTCTDGVCQPDNSQCGPCEECQDGGCVPAPGGKACTPRGPDTCIDTFWGLQDGDCFANGPLLGSCDGQAECHANACAQGERLVDCDASCIKDPGECEAGQPAVFDAMKLCEFKGTTEACNTTCEMTVDGDVAHVNSCHAGLCQEDQKIPCGNYRCRDDLKGCQESCTDSSDCAFTKVCMGGVCSG